MYELKTAILIIALCIGAIQDIRRRRISNWVTITGFIFLVILNFVDLGLPGLGYSLLGSGFAFTIGIVLRFFHSAGGGDTKLLMALGAFSGPLFLFESMKYFVPTCGFLSVLYLLSANKLRYTAFCITAKILGPIAKKSDIIASVSMPMAVPILISGVAALCF